MWSNMLCDALNGAAEMHCSESASRRDLRRRIVSNVLPVHHSMAYAGVSGIA